MQIMQDAMLCQFREGKDDLVQTVWDIIPQSLARFSTSNSSLQGETSCYFQQFVLITVYVHVYSGTLIKIFPKDYFLNLRVLYRVGLKMFLAEFH
jgi:hypothetical protein